MLFPILQALWQQFGPQVQQAVQQASPYIVSTMRQIPVPVYRQALWFLSENVSSWYRSLSDEDIRRMQRAIAWVVKDMVGDLAAAATGLPIGPFIDMGVEKVLDKVRHDNPSKEEVTYIQSELLRQLNKS
jgi:hypothetical protein